MSVTIASSWKVVLEQEFIKPYFQSLVDFVKKEYDSTLIYPPGKLIFNAFDKCSFEDTKVVLLGQDPYHGAGQAHGLSFSVNENVALPPSLVNIFKEIQNDLGKSVPKSGNLERWATQGVLLLNATLTVRANQAASHQNKGWETFTDAVIKILSEKHDTPLVFLLWGNYAQKKEKWIDTNKHLILKAKHPSPLSANQGGWFGNNHFSKTNDFLIKNHQKPIDW